MVSQVYYCLYIFFFFILLEKNPLPEGLDRFFAEKISGERASSNENSSLVLQRDHGTVAATECRNAMNATLQIAHGEDGAIAIDGMAGICQIPLTMHCSLGSRCLGRSFRRARSRREVKAGEGKQQS
jgi:hypothetical protein